MKIKYPNYDDSILSLTASVLKHFGVETIHESLPYFDNLLDKNPKNVVIMLFDGMGTALLRKHLPKGSFLRRNFVKSISSVFPPTTTAATISMETGLSPIEHGWLGWNLYFAEIGANVSIFPNTLSGLDGTPAAEYNVAQRYIPYKDIYTKIREATDEKVHAVSVSPFSAYKSKSINEICNSIKELCKKPKRNYIYTYWHQPDYDMHELGTSHAQITNNIRQINDEVEVLCSNVTDTVFIITADHGLVDTDWLFIPDYPEIVDCLAQSPSIEARALTFFIKPDRKKDFERLFGKIFGAHYLLLTKQQVIDTALFGQGKPHPRSNAFIGDFLAIATGNTSIELAPSTARDVFKAAHAGLTIDEMEVPLIVVET